jgi:HEAT repeat protein
MRRHVVRAAFLAAVVAVRASAAPIPTLNLATLVSESDVIVIGHTSIPVDIGPASPDARLMEGNIVIVTVPKGNISGTLKYTFTTPALNAGLPLVTPSGPQVFFLKQGTDSYEFVSAHYPSIVATTEFSSTAGDPLTKVIAAISGVLRTSDVRKQSKIEAAFALRGLDHPEAIEGLHLALRDSDPEVKLTAASTLLLVDDISGINVIESALVSPDASSSQSDSVFNARIALADGIRDRRAIPFLGRLVRQGDTETRRAAALGLGHTGSADAIRGLLGALDDPDFEVKLNAIHGLANIAIMPKESPSWRAFAADPDRYIVYWRHWAITKLASTP